MENLLKVHPKAYNKVYFFYYTLLALHFILFTLVTINFCLSFNSLNYAEEEDPDIDLTGINSFNFISSFDNYDYSPGMANLGTTGKIHLDCYIGECHFSETYDCSDSEGSSTCTHDYYYEDHDCSNECRKTGFYECSKSLCYNKSSYYYENNKCFRDNDDNEYTKTKSCYADNLILKWKDRYYVRNNVTTFGIYTYLNSAVPSNESCPYGKKKCGILDELGNILCYPNGLSCPINFITTNRDEIMNYKYSLITIGNKTIYYTTDATDNKVYGGLFVDSDLMIKYNDIDCKILDTSTISDLLLHNYNKLYRNSLDFDPYDEETSELDKRGKSYLKACVPGNGKEKNITKIKELLVEFNLNATNNGKIIKPIKNLFIVSYFISLPGYIISIIFLLVLLCSFTIQNNINSIIKFGCIKENNILLIIILFVSHIFTIAGSIISMVNNNTKLADGISLKLDSNIIGGLITINYITFILNILLVLLIVVFIIYLFKTSELGSDQISYYNQNSPNMPLNSNNASETEKAEYNVEDQMKGGFDNIN